MEEYIHTSSDEEEQKRPSKRSNESKKRRTDPGLAPDSPTREVQFNEAVNSLVKDLVQDFDNRKKRKKQQQRRKVRVPEVPDIEQYILRRNEEITTIGPKGQEIVLANEYLSTKNISELYGDAEKQYTEIVEQLKSIREDAVAKRGNFSNAFIALFGALIKLGARLFWYNRMEDLLVDSDMDGLLRDVEIVGEYQSAGDAVNMKILPLMCYIDQVIPVADTIRDIISDDLGIPENDDILKALRTSIIAYGEIFGLLRKKLFDLVGRIDQSNVTYSLKLYYKRTVTRFILSLANCYLKSVWNGRDALGYIYPLKDVDAIKKDYAEFILSYGTTNYELEKARLVLANDPGQIYTLWMFGIDFDYVHDYYLKLGDAIFEDNDFMSIFSSVRIRGPKNKIIRVDLLSETLRKLKSEFELYMKGVVETSLRFDNVLSAEYTKFVKVSGQEIFSTDMDMFGMPTISMYDPSHRIRRLLLENVAGIKLYNIYKHGRQTTSGNVTRHTNLLGSHQNVREQQRGPVTLPDIKDQLDYFKLTSLPSESIMTAIQKQKITEKTKNWLKGFIVSNYRSHKFATLNHLSVSIPNLPITMVRGTNHLLSTTSTYKFINTFPAGYDWVGLTYAIDEKNTPKYQGVFIRDVSKDIYHIRSDVRVECAGNANRMTLELIDSIETVQLEGGTFVTTALAAFVAILDQQIRSLNIVETYTDQDGLIDVISLLNDSNSNVDILISWLFKMPFTFDNGLPVWKDVVGSGAERSEMFGVDFRLFIKNLKASDYYRENSKQLPLAPASFSNVQTILNDIHECYNQNITRYDSFKIQLYITIWTFARCYLDLAPFVTKDEEGVDRVPNEVYNTLLENAKKAFAQNLGILLEEVAKDNEMSDYEKTSIRNSIVQALNSYESERSFRDIINRYQDDVNFGDEFRQMLRNRAAACVGSLSMIYNLNKLYVLKNIFELAEFTRLLKGYTEILTAKLYRQSYMEAVTNTFLMILNRWKGTEMERATTKEDVDEAYITTLGMLTSVKDPPLRNIAGATQFLVTNSKRKNPNGKRLSKKYNRMSQLYDLNSVKEVDGNSQYSLYFPFVRDTDIRPTTADQIQNVYKINKDKLVNITGEAGANIFQFDPDNCSMLVKILETITNIVNNHYSHDLFDISF